MVAFNIKFISNRKKNKLLNNAKIIGQTNKERKKERKISYFCLLCLFVFKKKSILLENFVGKQIYRVFGKLLIGDLFYFKIHKVSIYSLLKEFKDAPYRSIELFLKQDLLRILQSRYFKDLLDRFKTIS